MKKYVKELAMAAAEMLAKRDVLTAKDIVRHNFKGKAVSAGMVRDAERRLKDVKAAIEKMYKSPVYLVTEYYLDLAEEPKTLAEAKKCVPGYACRGKAVAIRLHTKAEKDLIWQASTMMTMAKFAGGMKKGFDRTLAAVAGGRVGKERAHHMLLEGVTRARPENTEAMSRLLGSNGNGMTKALTR